jgi:signal transduction histidine kinase
MTVTATPVQFYLRLWRGLGKELGFTLVSLPVVVVSCAVLVTGVSLGVSLAVIYVGIPLLVFTLLAARWFAGLELWRLEKAGRPRVIRADWSGSPTRAGIGGRILHVIADPRYWIQALHGALVNPVLGIVTGCIGVSWLAVAVGGVSYWYWGRWAGVAVPDESMTVPAAGLLAIITLPFTLHAMVLAHDIVAHWMLGEWQSTSLRRAAAASERSRQAAVLAEDYSLRRLERDIHDGPQQGLLRIQYDLASASRALEPDHAAANLVASALQVTKDTLHELRELSRGLAPPLLQDRGLVSAVRSLAARSEIPISTRLDVDQNEPGLGTIERSVYFVVSELFSNTTKHAGAKSASAALEIVQAGRGRRVLHVVVEDDGVGGASVVPGHGLDGIKQRVSGLGGTLAITSPLGGPSRFVIEIPLR